jgi:hypothetical protein
MGATTWEEAMSRAERHQPGNLVPVRLVGAAGAVVAVVLLVLFVRAATRSTPVAATRAPAVDAPAPASAASGPALSDVCRAALVTSNRMIAHGDAAVADLRAHKKLMDDYKSGKIDRAKALPQGSPWRQALARTLKQGTAAADQYDADKATYREQAAACSKGR